MAIFYIIAVSEHYTPAILTCQLHFRQFIIFLPIMKFSLTSTISDSTRDEKDLESLEELQNKNDELAKKLDRLTVSEKGYS